MVRDVVIISHFVGLTVTPNEDEGKSVLGRVSRNRRVRRTGHKRFRLFNWFWPVQRTLWTDYVAFTMASESASLFSGATGQTPATRRCSNRTQPNRSCRLAAIGRGNSPGARGIVALYPRRLTAS